MKNGFNIVWSDEAKFNLSRIIDYFETTWSEKELRKFFQRLEKTLQLIAKNPQLFRLTNRRKNVRKCVFSRQTSIYYKFENDTLYLITLFDNRQDPKKLKISKHKKHIA
ncbi:MAG: type II toxin-antitoxin system RelE/ParE family toxin [Bacteroidales bacterium]